GALLSPKSRPPRRSGAPKSITRSTYRRTAARAAIYESRWGLIIRASAHADFDEEVRARTRCYGYTRDRSRSGLISPRTREICDRKNLASGSVSSGEPRRSSRLRSESIALACPAGSFMIGRTPFTRHSPPNCFSAHEILGRTLFGYKSWPSGSRVFDRLTQLPYKSEVERHLRHAVGPEPRVDDSCISVFFSQT